MKTLARILMTALLSIAFTSCITTLPASTGTKNAAKTENTETSGEQKSEPVRRPTTPIVRPDNEPVQRPPTPIIRPDNNTKTTETKNTGRVDNPTGKNNQNIPDEDTGTSRRTTTPKNRR